MFVFICVYAGNLRVIKSEKSFILTVTVIVTLLVFSIRHASRISLISLQKKKDKLKMFSYFSLCLFVFHVIVAQDKKNGDSIVAH